MLFDIHVLQNHAPSNLNRDDTGAPKDAVFGGVVRARISSQAIKRAVRRSDIFADAFRDSGLLAQRTQRLPSLLRPRLAALDLAPDAVDLIVARSQEIGRESRKDKAKPTDAAESENDKAKPTDAGDRETAQLIFLADSELDELAVKLANLYQTEGRRGFEKLKTDEMTKRLGASVPRSVDIAMFGRMTTSAAFADVQASVQVAHAISTHKVESEFDYYTAVDDISGEAGAGFISDTAFNSATYYKYLSVHWEGLVYNLGGDRQVAAEAVRALISAVSTVSPTGKQNSFAAHNLPDLVLVEARPRNVPISYANAFLNPVWKRGNASVMELSATQLADYIDKVHGLYEITAQRAWIGTLADDAGMPATRLSSLRALTEWLPFDAERSA